MMRCKASPEIQARDLKTDFDKPEAIKLLSSLLKEDSPGLPALSTSMTRISSALITPSSGS